MEDMTKRSSDQATSHQPPTTATDTETAEETVKTIGPDIYEAEKIINHRYRDRKIQFLVKWRGWGTAHNTWEPEENIFCRQLIDIYRQKLESKGKSMHKRKHELKNSSTGSGKGKKDVESGKVEKRFRVKRSVGFITPNHLSGDKTSTSSGSQTGTRSRSRSNSFISDADETEITTEPDYKSSSSGASSQSSASNSTSDSTDFVKDSTPKFQRTQIKRRGPGRPSNAQKRRESIINCYSADLLPFITVTDVSVNGSTCTFVECKKREGFFKDKE